MMRRKLPAPHLLVQGVSFPAVTKSLVDGNITQSVIETIHKGIV